MTKHEKEVLHNYLQHLINKTFKILHLKEESLRTNSDYNYRTYLENFCIELKGFSFLYSWAYSNPVIIDYITIITYLSKIECSQKQCRRLVFTAMRLLRKIDRKYTRHQDGTL